MQITHQVLGCKLTGKDLLIGFDSLHQLPALRWSKQGLTSPPHFLPWTHIPKLYHLSYDPVIQMLQAACATSHSTFSHKHPLWKNENFFVHLPFKLNEDANPTTASHRGMTPKLYQQAVAELTHLQAEGIIEPTSSPWACEAFYVIKRAEQARGKLRLVVNYQPLNHFLADSKFPLPQKSDMFQHIRDAKLFSKFDLKSRFWQLGLHPADRPKTGFSIPNHHFQWTVLPFGLKTAPPVPTSHDSNIPTHLTKYPHPY